MKAERRQELKTNELAQMIEDSREFFRVWGSYLLGGLVVIGLIIAFTIYRGKASDEQLTEAWRSLQGVSFFDAKGEKKGDEEVRQTFARLEELAAGDRGPDFLMEVLSIQASNGLRLASAPKEGLDTAMLEKATQAYEAMRTRLPENPLAVALALNGLAGIEADRFVVDGDTNRKKTAQGLLEKLRDDPRFSGTPFQRSALERINKLDQVFRRVEFVIPPPPQQPVLDAATPLLPLGVTPELAPPSATPPPTGESPAGEAPAPEAPTDPTPTDKAPEPAPVEAEPAPMPAAEPATPPAEGGTP